MMFALVLQMLGLVGLPLGGFIVAGPGGGLVGLSASAIYVGVAMERD